MPLQNAIAVRIVSAITVIQARATATARTVIKEMAATAEKIANAEIVKQARETATAKQGTKAVSANIAKQVRETVTARRTARVAANVGKTANVSTVQQALR